MPDIPDLPRDFRRPRPNVQFSPAKFFGAILVFFLLLGVWTSFYTVPAESEGVVLRFGKYKEPTIQPGLRFKLPYGIDQVLQLPVKRQLKQEFGFATSGATNRWQFASSRSEQEKETMIVTGDLNAALVEWIIQYRITKPQEYLFKVRNPDATLRDVSESVMREVVGDRTVDEVITVGRQEIEDQAKVRMQELVDKYEMGLSLDQVQLKNVNPPRPVQASFNDVNSAQQDKDRLINVANGEYNKAVPSARGEADQKITAAAGYAAQRVNEAEGDAARFNALLTEYVKAPEVTRRRIYLETMTQVLSSLDRKVIIDDDVKQLLPLLNLGTQGGAQ